jgi:hypothetical protein
MAETFSTESLEGARAVPSLDEKFQDIQRDIASALGKDEEALAGLEIDAAIQIHDVLLSLRHWADDIRFEDGVFRTLGHKDKGLASMVQSFLDDVALSLANMRCFWTASIEKRCVPIGRLQNLMFVVLTSL